MHLTRQFYLSFLLGDKRQNLSFEATQICLNLTDRKKLLIFKKRLCTKTSTEELNIDTTLKMAILRDRNLNDMKASRFRTQSMLQGRNKVGYEIMDGVRRATKIDKMDFKSGSELHQSSQRYEKRKNREKKVVKSKAKSKVELKATIVEMEK